MTKSSGFLVAALMAAWALLQPVSGFAAERPNEDVIPRDPQPKTHETGALPPAWQLSGLSKAEYEGGTDKTVTLGGMPSGYIKSTGLNLTRSSTEGFGILITQQDAQPYRGQTVRFAAQVKTDAVQDHANLFISFASPTQEAGPWRVPTGRFNPKEDPRRPATTPKLSGTTDWTLLALDLDIPADATHVIGGIVLRGRGKAYINRISLDTVAPPSEPAAPSLMFGVPR